MKRGLGAPPASDKPADQLLTEVVGHLLLPLFRATTTLSWIMLNRLDTWHLLILSVVRWNMLSHTNKYHELCPCYKHVVSATDENGPVLLKRVDSSAMCINLHQRLHQYLHFIHINMYPLVNYITCWLVVWNMAFIFPYLGIFIIPTDELHHFSEGLVYHQPAMV